MQRGRVAVSVKDAYEAVQQTLLSADLPGCQ